MALTAQELQTARDWINRELGGTRDASGTYTNTGNTWSFNGDFDPNRLGSVDAGLLFGSGRRLGLSDTDLAQVFGTSSDTVSQAAERVGQVGIDMGGALFAADTASGFYDRPAPTAASVTTTPADNSLFGATSVPTNPTGAFVGPLPDDGSVPGAGLPTATLGGTTTQAPAAGTPPGAAPGSATGPGATPAGGGRVPGTGTAPGGPTGAGAGSGYTPQTTSNSSSTSISTSLSDTITVPGADAAQAGDIAPASVTQAPNVVATPATASLWNVDPNQTVQGQIANIIDADSPLMQRAETRAAQQANARGLLNSSMAVQAGQAALYDAALPIAQQDADTFARASQFNATAQTDVSKFNADAMLRAGIVNQEQANSMTQFAASEANRMAMFELNNDTDVAKFNASESNAMKKLGLDSQTKLGLAQIEANYKTLMQTSASAADVYKSLLAQMGSVLANPDLDAGAKAAALQNLVGAMNASLGVIGQIANMNLPELDFSDLPDTTAPTGAQPNAAQQQQQTGSGWQPGDVGSGGGPGNPSSSPSANSSSTPSAADGPF